MNDKNLKINIRDWHFSPGGYTDLKGKWHSLPLTYSVQFTNNKTKKAIAIEICREFFHENFTNKDLDKMLKTIINGYILIK